MFTIEGPDFYVTLDDIREHDPRLALDWPIAPPGDATAQCEYILDMYGIECSPETARAMLRPYGAWDDSELDDHRENLLRLVWIVGCDLYEQGESCLSTY